MKQCNRCSRWFRGTDSNTCDPCWEEMGQMQFWQDHPEEEEEWEDPRIAAAEERRIDSIFDRDLNRDLNR